MDKHSLPFDNEPPSSPDLVAQPPLPRRRRRHSFSNSCTTCMGKKMKCSQTRPACDACVRYNRECKYLESPVQRGKPKGGLKSPPSAVLEGEKYSSTFPLNLTEMPSSRHDTTAEPTTTRDDSHVSQKDSSTTSISSTVTQNAQSTRTGESACPRRAGQEPSKKAETNERPEGDAAR